MLTSCACEETILFEKIQGQKCVIFIDTIVFLNYIQHALKNMSNQIRDAQYCQLFTQASSAMVLHCILLFLCN